MDAARSPIDEVADVAGAARTFRMRAEFDLSPTKRLRTSISSRSIDGTPHRSLSMDVVSTRSSTERVVDVADVADAMRQVASSYPKATLRPDTIQMVIDSGQTTASKLRPVVVRAWHEVFGLPVPTLEELAAQDKARKAARKADEAARKAADGDLVALLKSGPAGVEELSRRARWKPDTLDLRKADLAGARLDEVRFNGADLEGADLSGASLARAVFCGLRSRLKRARLVAADLRSANLACCQGSDADFSGAILTDASMVRGTFRRTKFVGADLSRANFFGSDLRGSDFTDARIDDIGLQEVKFDETTGWPPGYLPPPGAKWKGTGPDPRLAPPKPDPGSSEPPPADLPALLNRLKRWGDPAKLDKALAMLKADRFQLFARVADDHLVGVVRSQSNPTLVYACRLAADGHYACCTQNLNVCGGLRGSPCKHLLVLIVGLARAGQLEPGIALAWIRASRGRKAELDRDAMTEVFLRYKGAEAGELDWRPTETIPEDFYAM